MLSNAFNERPRCCSSSGAFYTAVHVIHAGACAALKGGLQRDRASPFQCNLVAAQTEIEAIRDDIASTWLEGPLSFEQTADKFVRPALQQVRPKP